MTRQVSHPARQLPNIYATGSNCILILVEPAVKCETHQNEFHHDLNLYSARLAKVIRLMKAAWRSRIDAGANLTNEEPPYSDKS